MAEQFLRGCGVVGDMRAPMPGIGIKDKQQTGLMRALLSSTQTTDLASNLQTEGLYFYQVPSILLDPGFTDQMSILRPGTDNYRFQRGVVFSMIGASAFPSDFFSGNTLPKVNASLFSEYSSWFLCDNAEQKLKTAVDETGVIAIDAEEGTPAFLLKFDGKMSGLCLQDVETPDGKVFIKGNWYSPTDTNTREQLKTCFDSGEGRTTMSGSWALMRTITPYDGKKIDDLVDELSQLAQQIPKIYPNQHIAVDGTFLTRREYRVRKMEQG